MRTFLQGSIVTHTIFSVWNGQVFPLKTVWSLKKARWEASETCGEVMQIIPNGLFSARKEGVLLTIRHCSKIKRKKAHSFTGGGNQAKNIRQDLMPAGSGRNIPKPPITPHGKRKIRYTTQQLKIQSFYHGSSRFQACRGNWFLMALWGAEVQHWQRYPQEETIWGRKSPRIIMRLLRKE